MDRRIFRKEALDAATASKADGALIPFPPLPLRSFLVLCLALAAVLALLLCGWLLGFRPKAPPNGSSCPLSIRNARSAAAGVHAGAGACPSFSAGDSKSRCQ